MKFNKTVIWTVTFTTMIMILGVSWLGDMYRGTFISQQTLIDDTNTNCNKMLVHYSKKIESNTYYTKLNRRLIDLILEDEIKEKKELLEQ